MTFSNEHAIEKITLADNYSLFSTALSNYSKF